MRATEDCEAAMVAHWSQLGDLEGGQRHEEEGIVWFETPIRHLPYNGVLHLRLRDEDADTVIARVLERFRSRGVDCWWAVHPSATPADLGDRLSAAGLDLVERMNFMSLELAGWQSPLLPEGVEIRPAVTAEEMDAYTRLTLRYWEVPDEEAPAVVDVHRQIRPNRFPGQRYLALLDDRPVGKAYLSWPGPPGVVSLYGMSVLPEARGRGVARALTAAMMADAHERGFARAVLHATDMAVGVYRGTGFERCGGADLYATAPVWTDP